MERSWVEELAELQDNEGTDAAIDRLFDLFDDLHFAGRFEESDSKLYAGGLDRLNDKLLVGLLTITVPARDHLPSRPALVQRVEELLLARGRSKKELQRLLEGLH